MREPQLPERLAALPVRQSPNITTYQGKVVLFTSFYERKGHAEYIASMVPTIAALERLGIRWDYRTMAGDFHFERALNSALSFVRDSEDDTDIILIDSDEAWEPEAILRLLSHPVDVVCGSYRMKNHWHQYVAMPAVDEDGDVRGRMLGDGTALLLAWRITGGFTRLTRNALRIYSDAYPELHYREAGQDCCAYLMSEIKDGGMWSHDYLFSERWKALGLDLWIDPTLTIWHYGQTGYRGNLDEFLRAERAKIDALKAAQEKAKELQISIPDVQTDGP